MTPEQQLSDLVARFPEQAVMEMLKQIFKATAEIHAAMEAHTKVLGVIAGRVGVSGPQLRALLDNCGGKP